jgi:hypothetical protein
MDSKVSAVTIALAFAVNSVYAGTYQPTKYSSVQYFKNYALSTCIADGYSSEETIKDASAAARGYLELGSLPLEAHTEATLLGREFLKKRYISISGESLVLMKCIDLFHSKELDRIARKYRGKN